MAKFRKNHGSNKNPFVGMTIRIFLMIAIAAALFIFGFQGFQNQDSTPSDHSIDQTLFTDHDRSFLIPSSNRNDIEVIDHMYYSVGYVEQYEQAAWVCYVLNKSELVIPNVQRHDRFLEDPDVSTGSANYYDYRGSGYSRGHMAPAGDMAFNEEAMRQSFYMSNMSPQRIPFNGGIWRELEETVRDWAYKNDRLYVITGPMLNTVSEYVGQKNKVGVPRKYYKAVLDAEGPELKAIAFIMENEVSERPIMDYAVTIDELEEELGMELYDQLLDDSIESEIESKIDINKWPVSRKKYDLRVKHWNNR